MNNGNYDHESWTLDWRFVGQCAICTVAIIVASVLTLMGV
jgi:hypothetical protein